MIRVLITQKFLELIFWRNSQIPTDWKVQILAFPGFLCKTLKNKVHKQDQTPSSEQFLSCHSFYACSRVDLREQATMFITGNIFHFCSNGRKFEWVTFFTLNMESYPFSFHRSSSSSIWLSWIFSVIVCRASWEILLIS